MFATRAQVDLEAQTARALTVLGRRSGSLLDRSASPPPPTSGPSVQSTDLH